MPPRAVELIRVSSAGQAESGTPDDQRRALDALRRHRPCQVVERIEQQVSGATDLAHRPDLQRLAELAAARAFDEVRVRHLDRLTRHADPGERSAILAMVYRAGAVIVDAAGTVLDPKTMAGELVWVVQTLGAAEERRKIAERTKAGKVRLASQGRLVDGRPPWGRRFEGEAWSLTPDAATYRRLFDLAREGRSLPQIAAAMNETSAAPRGGPWTPGIVHHMLHAEHARGVYRAHGHEIAIPEIVPAEVQRQAIEALKRRSKGGRIPVVRALLRGLIRCECGAVVWVRLGADARHYYYACPRSCGPWRRVEETDEEVRVEVRRWLRTYKPGKKGPADERTMEEEIAAAETDLRRIEGEEERLARLRVRGEVPAKLAAKLAGEIRARKSAAETRLQDAQASLQSAREAETNAEDALAAIVRLRSKLDAWEWSDWRETAESLFRGPGAGALLTREGEIVLRGYLSPSVTRGAMESGDRWEGRNHGATLRLVV